MDQQTTISEIEQLKIQLKSIDEQRLDIILSIKQKYHALINNADDALKYALEYITIAHPCNIWNIEDNKAYFGSYRDSTDHFNAVAFAFKEICRPYINIIRDEIHSNGCIITFERV